MSAYKVKMLLVDKFWNWFSENCRNFGPDFSNSQLLMELDSRVRQLGDFTWEVGPGKIHDSALVISPAGNIDLLPTTKEIIQNARKCEGWEYYYAKPPKEWGLIFDFQTAGEGNFSVNASQWEYVLLQYEDGMFEIIIKAPELKVLNEDDQIAAVEIVLDGVLGEEVRLNKIDAIEVVVEFEKEYRGKAGKIEHLAAHLKTLDNN